MTEAGVPWIIATSARPEIARPALRAFLETVERFVGLQLHELLAPEPRSGWELAAGGAIYAGNIVGGRSLSMP